MDNTISSLLAMFTNQTYATQNTSSTPANGDAFMSLLDSIGANDNKSAKSSSLFGDTSLMGFSSATFGVFGMSGGDANNTSDIDAMAIQDTLAGNGPLPAYIRQYSASKGLDMTQQQALMSIAINNINTDGSQASILKMAQELQDAGI